MSSGAATSGMLEVSLAPRRSLTPMVEGERHSRRSLTPGDGRGVRSRSASPYGDLSSKVALFNKHASNHLEAQATNPFSGDGRVSPRPRLDKNDASYGKPVGKTALRGLKAQSQVSKEILELCEVVAENGESLSDGPGDDDHRTAISFGHLFHIYTYISSKVVGILLRARKQKLVDFEGETLFQKRDDHVPIILLKPIQEIRDIFRTAEQKERELRKQQEHELYLQEHPEVLIEEEMKRAYDAELTAQQEQDLEAEVGAEQPKPAVEFQLRVHDFAEDAAEPQGGDADVARDDAGPEKQGDDVQPGEPKPSGDGAQEPAPAAQQPPPEPSPASCQPDKTPEAEDFQQTALASPAEEQKAQEKSC